MLKAAINKQNREESEILLGVKIKMTFNTRIYFTKLQKRKVF